MSSTRAGLGILGGTLALVLLPACASQDPAEPATAPPRPVSAAEAGLLERAEQVLISRCMVRRGFEFTPNPEPPAATRSFPYVLDDIAWARVHGYGGADQRRRTEARRDDPNQRYFQSLPPDRRKAALAALNGGSPVGLSAPAPVGGTVHASDRSCRADAQRRLYGNLPAWFRARVVVSNLRPMYGPKVERDPRFTAAVATWAACMRRNGHPYDSPDKLRQALDAATRKVPAPAAHATEVRLAVAEATCAQRSGLAARVRELDQFYADPVRARYRAEIDTKARLQRAALPRAREILADRT